MLRGVGRFCVTFYGINSDTLSTEKQCSTEGTERVEAHGPIFWLLQYWWGSLGGAFESRAWCVVCMFICTHLLITNSLTFGSSRPPTYTGYSCSCRHRVGKSILSGATFSCEMNVCWHRTCFGGNILCSLRLAPVFGQGMNLRVELCSIQ